MDPRLISTLPESPGWKVLYQHLLQTLKDTDEQLVNATIDSEAKRLQFAQLQGYRAAMQEVLGLPMNPQAVRQNSDPSHYGAP
tara:strand:+ start:328 stop:576 length:249 start_codon:yes stop_codon:yes gene_type:complete